MNAYTLAKERYAALGVDTEAVLNTLKDVTVSVHCWQGDDVVGFDAKEALSGGIQTTGNYPGKATTPEQLMADFDEVLRLTPGKAAPKSGIYAAMVRYPEGGTACAKPGVCNIGSRPTVNDDTRDVTVETYILDCHTDLYGAEIAVSLYSYLRGERRFPDLAALSAQIGRDAETTARYFAESESDEAQNTGNKTE